MLPFYVGGFTFSVPYRPSVLAFLPVPDVFTSSGVFGVHGLCFSIRASIWAFSVAIHFASLSFISFCIHILLAFSSTSLLASFSINCLSISVALFLSYLGLSSFTILAISISSSSGTFCLCVLTFVLGYIFSV